MKKVLNGIRGLASIIVSILLFVLLLALGIDISIKCFLKTTTFSKAVQEIEFQVIFLDEENKETETGKKLYDYFEGMGITRNEVNKLLKNEQFKELFGKYFGSILLKNLNDETEIVYLTKDEIYNFVIANYDFFKKIINVNEENKEEIKNIIYKEYDSILLELETIASELTKEPLESKYIDNLLMPVLTWALIVGILVCIILLLLLRKSLYKWLMWFYMPSMTAALTLGFISLCTNKIISLLLTENVREYVNLIKPFVGAFSKFLLIYSIVLFTLSIITFVVHFVIKQRKEENK